MGEISQDQREITDEKSLDDIINEADVYIDGEKVDKTDTAETEEKKEETEKPETEKVETEEVEGEKETESTEEKSASETEEKPVEPEELTPEKFEELSKKHPELKTYKETHENYANWEKSLRQKAQAIAFINNLPVEKQEIFFSKTLPYVYGKEELPKAPKELVDDVMKSVIVEDIEFQDEDEIKHRIDKEKIIPQVRRAVELVLNNAIPEMGATRKTLLEREEKIKGLEENIKASQGRLGELEFENLIAKHPFLELKRVDNNESILDAVGRISSAGDGHPEYPKLLKLQTIGNLADSKGWSPERAFQSLYAEEERAEKNKIREKQVIEKNQKESTQEQPGGEKPKTKEDWEEAMGDLGEREEKINKEFEKAGV